MMDDQENDDQIPDPDEALKEEVVKLEVWKVGRFRDYLMFAIYISRRL